MIIPERFRAITVSGGSDGYSAIVIEQANGVLNLIASYDGREGCEKAAKVADELNLAYARAALAAFAAAQEGA